MKKMLIVILILCIAIPCAASVIADTDNTIFLETTLKDNIILKGSKKTINVWARDANGNKIESSVTLNGINVPHTWDDTDKTSYTLSFSREGVNTIVVSARAGGKTRSKAYTVIYQKSSKGDVIGTATWSIELFTIGNGYLVEPVEFEIVEGENAADALIRLIHHNGYVAFHGGATSGGFYLAYIGSGDKTQKVFNGYTNSYVAYGAPKSARNLTINTSIPSVIVPHLENAMSYFDDKDYSNWVGYMGEFIYTNGSGWMYSINNVFPNVGFSDYFLTDGDVVRVQFTLAYGADIGGTSALGSGIGSDLPLNCFYTVANKDKLTAMIASTDEADHSVKTKYDAALKALMKVNATQSEIDAAYANLSAAITEYKRGEQNTTPPPTEKVSPGKTNNRTSEIKTDDSPYATADIIATPHETSAPTSNKTDVPEVSPSGNSNSLSNKINNHPKTSSLNPTAVAVAVICVLITAITILIRKKIKNRGDKII